MTDHAELRPAEREGLYAPDRRLNAYYFGFDSTGSPAIDAILSAVAHAGKSYHHTEGWSDEDSRWGEDRSHVDVIQAAAHEAAAQFAATEAARLTLRAQRDRVLSVARDLVAAAPGDEISPGVVNWMNTIGSVLLRAYDIEETQ